MTHEPRPLDGNELAAVRYWREWPPQSVDHATLIDRLIETIDQDRAENARRSEDTHEPTEAGDDRPPCPRCGGMGPYGLEGCPNCGRWADTPCLTCGGYGDSGLKREWCPDCADGTTEAEPDDDIAAQVARMGPLSPESTRAVEAVLRATYDHLVNPPALDGTTEAEIVHRTPREGQGQTPCCGRTPFELPQSDRMSNDDSLVTCRAALDGTTEADPACICGHPNDGHATIGREAPCLLDGCDCVDYAAAVEADQ